jgi:hypothetical protein
MSDVTTTALHNLFRRCIAGAAPFVLLLLVGNAAAQGTPLKPPSSALTPPSSAAKPALPATALTAPSAPAASSPAQTTTSSSIAQNSPGKASPVALTRFKMVKVDGKMLDLTKLPDSTVLKGKSGKTITVARIKQLQARLDGVSTAPMITAQKGQSLKSLAAAPVGTMIALPGGKVTRSQDVAKVQNLVAKLSVKRVIKPAPMSLKTAQPTAVVGQGLTLADAMKRPASDVIQVGSRKYTAEQLRQMDALLKASPREPRGLLDRAASASGRTGNAPGSARLPGSGTPAGQTPAKSIRKGDGK